jgi:hypothetical protein
MKLFNLSLNHYNLFCPATGVQIMSSDFIDKSPALILNWCDLNDELEESTDEIQNIMKECIEDIEKEKYSDYPFQYYSDYGKAFELLINKKLKSFSNYILYGITNEGIACGPNRDTAYLAFDMGYNTIFQGKIFNKDYFICNSFYCPVTGEKLYENGFEPKHLPPSIELYYVTNPVNNKITIRYISDYFKEKFKKQNIEISDPKINADFLDTFLTQNFNTNYASHSLTSPESEKDSIHNYVIDMNYFEEEEEEENKYEHLPDISTFVSILEKYQKNNPQLDGYAVAINNKLNNQLSFYFYNSTPEPYVSFHEWDELMPAIIFHDYINKNYSDIPSNKYDELNNLFCSYCLGEWSTSAKDPKGIEELEGFMKYTNEGLESSEILFLGPIEGLFNGNSNLTSDLIEKFGKNPKDNPNEYLQFLKKLQEIT